LLKTGGVGKEFPNSYARCSLILGSEAEMFSRV
jgi:hypothetical protein